MSSRCHLYLNLLECRVKQALVRLVLMTPSFIGQEHGTTDNSKGLYVFWNLHRVSLWVLVGGSLSYSHIIARFGLLSTTIPEFFFLIAPSPDFQLFSLF